MLVALGFLSASLLALAAVPALARRAERLARRRAEAAFPLSLAEIAADRDHLRAELAMRARTLEQEAERGFAAKAVAMRELGRRDMRIGELDAELRDRAAQIAALSDELEATRGRWDETRTALTGTGGDLAVREGELAREREALGRSEARLAEREGELAKWREEHDQLRVSQVEDRTRIMVLETQARDLSERLAAEERGLRESRAALSAMTGDRDRERLRADALAARIEQAEAGLATADARAAVAVSEAQRLETRLAQERQNRHDESQARPAMEREQGRMNEMLQAREAQLQTARAEVRTLQEALEEARTERERLKRQAEQALKAGAAAPAPDPAVQAALRKEITAVAERLMALRPKREAAE